MTFLFVLFILLGLFVLDEKINRIERKVDRLVDYWSLRNKK